MFRSVYRTFTIPYAFIFYYHLQQFYNFTRSTRPRTIPKISHITHSIFNRDTKEIRDQPLKLNRRVGRNEKRRQKCSLIKNTDFPFTRKALLNNNICIIPSPSELRLSCQFYYSLLQKSRGYRSSNRNVYSKISYRCSTPP